MLKNKGIYIIPALGFLSVIILGWIILMMPICTKTLIQPLDHMFIAVSAVCVDGFTTVDISSSYTFIGQLVIAILTEIGAVRICNICIFYTKY